MIFAIAGAFAVFASVTLLVMWAAGLRSTTAEVRLGKLASARVNTAITPESPMSERLLFPFVDTLTRMFVQLLPSTFVEHVSRDLVAAGRPMSSQAYFTIMILLAGGLPTAALSFAIMSTGGLPAFGVLGAFVCALAGLLLPIFMLRRAVRARKVAIWKSLADAFDLITLSVEAGLGLDAAMRQVAQKLKGPLAEEIAQMLREVGMGRPRREALEDLAARTGVAELETFVNAVVQAEQLGTSLGRVLRSQSATLRIRRRQKAEETARRAPVKMVFPLVLFIMPTFFIVTIGPIFVRLVNYLNE